MEYGMSISNAPHVLTCDVCGRTDAERGPDGIQRCAHCARLATMADALLARRGMVAFA